MRGGRRGCSLCVVVMLRLLGVGKCGAHLVVISRAPFRGSHGDGLDSLFVVDADDGDLN
jgi:hypothetical protein